MPSVILVVFVVQLLLSLISTVGAQAINDLAWYLFTLLPTPQSRAAKENLKLRSEVVQLERELRATSAQDEFAKWAKIRRQHDKAKAKYEQEGSYTCLLPISLQGSLLYTSISWSHAKVILRNSILPHLLPLNLHVHRLQTPLARHPRRELPTQHLLLQNTHVLPPTRLGTISRRMAALLPSRARRRCICQRLGNRMRERDRDGNGIGRGSVGFEEGRRESRREGQDTGEHSRRCGREKEGVVRHEMHTVQASRSNPETDEMQKKRAQCTTTSMMFHVHSAILMSPIRQPHNIMTPGPHENPTMQVCACIKIASAQATRNECQSLLQ